MGRKRRKRVKTVARADPSSVGDAAAEPSDAPDVAAIESEQCPSRPWPADTAQRCGQFQVVIRQSVLNDIHDHGRSVSGIEVCGVLVGTLCKDQGAPFLHIEANIRGEGAAQHDTHVTFTAEVWARMQAVLEQQHPDQRIVGWYHTHPDFGIFLSEMDLFAHRSFFDLPWQVALVYDPVRSEQGLFVWREGRPTLQTPVVQADVPAQDTTADVETEAPQESAADAAAMIPILEQRLMLLERRQRWLLPAGLALGLLTILWPLVFLLWTPDYRPAVRPPRSTTRPAPVSLTVPGAPAHPNPFPS